MTSFLQLAAEKDSFWWVSPTNFGPSYFVRALTHSSDSKEPKTIYFLKFYELFLRAGTIPLQLFIKENSVM